MGHARPDFSMAYAPAGPVFVGSADIVQKGGDLQYHHVGTFPSANVLTQLLHPQAMVPGMAAAGIGK